ncbi:hypothetical protein HN446_02965 [bacterium]|jgi:hypothetical protein|nr:hypothetical protein [bacterium]
MTLYKKKLFSGLICLTLLCATLSIACEENSKFNLPESATEDLKSEPLSEHDAFLQDFDLNPGDPSVLPPLPEEKSKISEWATICGIYFFIKYVEAEDFVIKLWNKITKKKNEKTSEA